MKTKSTVDVLSILQGQDFTLDKVGLLLIQPMSLSIIFIKTKPRMPNLKMGKEARFLIIMTPWGLNGKASACSAGDSGSVLLF